MLKIEYQLEREKMLTTGEDAANYMLVKIFPSSEELNVRFPLNLSLVIDNSGSMYDSDQRIVHAIDAACHVIDMLDSQDFVSVVGFSDTARVFQSSSNAVNKQTIKRAIRAITSWESGGTRMAAGMKKACEEIRQNLLPDRVNQVLLLTDGNTEAEYECERIAKQEIQNGIVFSTFGVGDDWNKPLLAKMSDLGRGRWYYIDKPGAIPEIFERELVGLKKTVFNNVVLTTSLKKGVMVKKVRLVEPEIADVVTDEVSEREVVVKLGAIQADSPILLLFHLSLEDRKPGSYIIANSFATYDVPEDDGQRRRSEHVRMEVTFTSDPSEILRNSQVLKYADMEHVNDMVRRGTALAEKGDKARATILLSSASRIADRSGDDQKTKLIEDALEELGSKGRIDRKTQLAMEDRARKTRLMSEDEILD